MIKISLKSTGIKEDQLAKYYQTAFLSFNSTQKKILSQATIEADIVDGSIEVAFRRYPIMKLLIVSLCKRIMSRDENAIWEASVTDDGYILFETPEPGSEPEPEIDSERTNSTQVDVSPETETEQRPEPDTEPEQPKFDATKYAALTVSNFKGFPRGTFLKKQLQEILVAEKAGQNRVTFIAYLNKLIAG